ncbi:PE domain-containing protein [Saccharopolyspora sp. 5N708]|uniref:PE domain-containing protein n=1 Tax=Saccharopolyspora sp. 5N708 TaxID=3457424 RepID=UPI003FD4C6CE
MTEPSDRVAQERDAQDVIMNPLTGMLQIPLTAASSTGASAGGFEVAPEDLNAVKADLDAALDELKLAARDVIFVHNVKSPGRDEVSEATTEKIVQHLAQGLGSAVQTLHDMRRWVENFRDQIDAAQREYQRIDEGNEVREQ